MIANRVDQDQPELADPPVAVPLQAADPLAATVTELQRENAELRARVAQYEAPARRWLGLKACARHENIRYETLRRWVTRGSVVARKDHGRIFADLHSVQQFVARSRDA